MKKIKGVILNLDRVSSLGEILVNMGRDSQNFPYTETFFFNPDDLPKARKGDHVTFVRAGAGSWIAEEIEVIQLLTKSIA